jgi:hypothetical protein
MLCPSLSDSHICVERLLLCLVEINLASISYYPENHAIDKLAEHLYLLLSTFVFLLRSSSWSATWLPNSGYLIAS